jgi:AraC family transcriptional activator of tynA and feaB
MEGAQLATGFVIRARIAPDLVSLRTPKNIADSTDECYIVAFCISGEFAVEQGGVRTRAKAGDVVVYDSAMPARVICGGSSRQDYLGLYIPKSALADKSIRSGSLANVVVSRHSMLNPLSQCLTFMAHNILTCPEEEMSGLWDACGALIPVATGCYRSLPAENLFETPNPAFRRILGLVDSNLSDPSLSAAEVAAILGLSDRYVHKLFASHGTTFSQYVRAKRLDHVLAELCGGARPGQQISQIAYRWGFNDI